MSTRISSTGVSFGALQALQTLALFPAWWYGTALAQLFRQLRGSFFSERAILQLRLLLRHQFSPLFGGDGSWEMHLISVVIRVPLTLSVALWTAASAVGAAALLLLWVLLPVFTVLMLGYQFSLLSTSPFVVLSLPRFLP